MCVQTFGLYCTERKDRILYGKSIFKKKHSIWIEPSLNEGENIPTL